jgi:hypothetical protein
MHSFTANPPAVPTFGKTTLSWEVSLPVVPSDVPVGITLDGNLAPPVGHKEVSLASPHTFTLGAVTEHNSRTLATLTVNVDRSQCQSMLVLDGDLFSRVLEGQLNSQFNAVDQVKLRGDKTQATLGDASISIHIPLELEVPDWFNADMDIDIQLEALLAQGAYALTYDPVGKKWAGHAVRIFIRGVHVDVSWDWYEHMLGLGVTAAVQAGMEQVAEALMAHIVAQELVPALEQGFTDQVTGFIDGLMAADSGLRVYKLLALNLSSAGLNVTACPMPTV